MQKVSVTGKSSISESNELREVSDGKRKTSEEDKNKKNEPVYENVTIIKRVTERTLTAENVNVSI